MGRQPIMTGTKASRMKPSTRMATLVLANNGFTYAFPKHSLTILRLKLQ